MLSETHSLFASNTIMSPSSHKRAGSRALVSPRRWQGADSLVVAGQTVDAGLDENEAELGVLVLAVALEVLADGDGLRKY